MKSSTQAFWDSQFKFSSFLPDFENSLARMAADSETVAARHRLTRRDYGDHSRQWVEWMEGYGPQDTLPVVIHGGYWRALTAETHRFIMGGLVGHGARVANIEYRLMPEVRLADVVADTKAALNLLAGTFPEARMILIGHSAGAHLALHAMSDPSMRGRTRGIVALSGVFDLAPVAQSFLQAELRLTPEEVNVFTLKPESPRPEIHYVNGSAETHEFLRSSAIMATASNAMWTVLDGSNHMTLPHSAVAQIDTLLSPLLELDARS